MNVKGGPGKILDMTHQEVERPAGQAAFLEKPLIAIGVAVRAADDACLCHGVPPSAVSHAKSEILP